MDNWEGQEPFQAFFPGLDPPQAMFDCAGEFDWSAHMPDPLLLSALDDFVGAEQPFQDGADFGNNMTTSVLPSIQQQQPSFVHSSPEFEPAAFSEMTPPGNYSSSSSIASSSPFSDSTTVDETYSSPRSETNTNLRKRPAPSLKEVNEAEAGPATGNKKGAKGGDEGSKAKKKRVRARRTGPPQEVIETCAVAIDPAVLLKLESAEEFDTRLEAIKASIGRPLTEQETEVMRKQRRMVKNRLSAKKSRTRKSSQLEVLEEKNEVLQSENAALAEANKELLARVAALENEKYELERCAASVRTLVTGDVFDAATAAAGNEPVDWSSSLTSPETSISISGDDLCQEKDSDCIEPSPKRSRIGTAIDYFSIGGSEAATEAPDAPKGARRTAAYSRQRTALFVILLGFATLFQAVFNTNVGVDQPNLYISPPQYQAASLAVTDRDAIPVFDSHYGLDEDDDSLDETSRRRRAAALTASTAVALANADFSARKLMATDDADARVSRVIPTARLSQHFTNAVQQHASRAMANEEVENTTVRGFDDFWGVRTRIFTQPTAWFSHHRPLSQPLDDELLPDSRPQPAVQEALRPAALSRNDSEAAHSVTVQKSVPPPPQFVSFLVPLTDDTASLAQLARDARDANTRNSTGADRAQQEHQGGDGMDGPFLEVTAAIVDVAVSSAGLSADQLHQTFQHRPSTAVM